jgi:hypothetical protein
MKYLKLTLIFFAANIALIKAQSAAQKYSDADFHLLNKNYALALPLYLDVLSSEQGNANLNYKVGVCYLNSTSTENKKKAIPYLEQAVKSINKNYEEFSQTEKKASPEALFELAKAYHNDYKFDDAIKYFEMYKAELGLKTGPDSKDIDERIEMSKNGKEYIKTPKNITIVNLGDSVNSEYPDYAPVISADETTLIFTTRRKGGTTDELTIEDNQYYEDIYISTKNKNGEWGKARAIGSNINTAGHEASIGLSADGQQLFIYRSTFDKKDNGGGDIYKSDLNGDVWTVPQKLGSDINTPDSWETSAALSSDNQTLYFVSDRKGGLGGRDIYFCVKLPNGEWSKAQNIGAPINTDQDEDGPFIHPGGKELFFASKGHKSMGGFDIFVSTKAEEEGVTKWSEPTNIGYPINTTDDDVFFVTSTDGKRGYYSSFQDGGYGEKDIYQISLVDQTEKALAVVKGYMKMFNGKPLPFDSKISVYNADTKELLKIDTKPNTKTGKYLVVLPTNKKYTLVYEVPGCDKVTRELSLDDNMSLNKIDRAYQMDTVIMCKGSTPLTPEQIAKEELKKQPGYHNKDEKGKDIPEPPALLNPFELQIFFIYNYNKIPNDDPKFVEFINNVAAEMNKSGRKMEISIEASASKVPTATFKSNDRLSSSRADLGKKSILSALKDKGVDLKNIKVVKADYLIQGPEYNKDYVENRLEYEKWQYIRVSAK